MTEKGGVSIFKLSAQTLAREMRAVAASAVARAGGEIAKSLVTLVNSVLAAAAAVPQKPYYRPSYDVIETPF